MRTGVEMEESNEPEGTEDQVTGDGVSGTGGRFAGERILRVEDKREEGT